MSSTPRVGGRRPVNPAESASVNIVEQSDAHHVREGCAAGADQRGHRSSFDEFARLARLAFGDVDPGERALHLVADPELKETCSLLDVHNNDKARSIQNASASEPSNSVTRYRYRYGADR